MADYYPQNMSEKPMRDNQMLDMSAQRIDDSQYRYNYNPFTYNYSDIFQRAIKYFFEGLAVAFVAYAFTRGKLDWREIAMLGITAAFVFAILDTFSPTISLGARFGAGFGIGQSLLGPALAMAPIL